MRRLLSVFTGLLLLSIPASADLIVTLDHGGVMESPPGGFYQPGLCTNSDGSGDCVIFTGSISTGGDESQNYYLESLVISMSASNPDGGADVNDNTPQSATSGNAFFLNATSLDGVLGPLNTGSSPYSYSGGLFEVDVAPGTPSGGYFGTATLAYTNDTSCTDPSSPCFTAPVNFEVVVPEPSVFGLTAAGLAVIAARRRRVRP
jgi:hypothetical protein